MRFRLFTRQFGLALCALTLLLISGCATRPPGTTNPNDPLESSNRAVFEFNDTIDRAVLKPAAEAYAFVVPQPVRTCINNIFLNIGDVWSWFNSTLQGRQVDALNTFGRVLLNSTMGIGGCLDIASQTGAKRIPNDFGVTLGVWGLDSGPYLVLPLLGSTTLRDGAGRAVDLYVNQVGYGSLVNNIDVRNSIYGLEVVQRREALLDVTNTVDRTALDRYSFIRDAYLKRRKAQVDGATAEAEKLPNYEDFEAAPADEKALGLNPKK
jgi:phospholipid-binding lipoprotein MlaA